jgi:hypothetical protein
VSSPEQGNEISALSITDRHWWICHCQISRLRLRQAKRSHHQSLRRKNAVSDIWATWCGCSVSELGSFARFQHLHPELKLLLVARDSTVPEIKKVFRAQGISGYGKDAERKS